MLNASVTVSEKENGGMPVNVVLSFICFLNIFYYGGVKADASCAPVTATVETWDNITVFSASVFTLIAVMSGVVPPVMVRVAAPHTADAMSAVLGVTVCENAPVSSLDGP